MLFYMALWWKKSKWSNLNDSLILNIPIMFVDFTSSFMDLSWPQEFGFTACQLLF
jgi:hypothetical protein